MARPRNEDRIDIPTAAVTAGLRLVDKRGVDAIVLADIADAIGCRAPALYRYFPDKNALLLEVHNAAFQLLYDGKVDVSTEAQNSSLKQLELGGFAYVQFAMDHPHLYELMFNSAGPQSGLERQRLNGCEGEDYAMRSISFLRESIEQCQAEGYFRGMGAETIAFTYWSAIHGAISLALRSRISSPNDDAQSIANAVVETMMTLAESTK